MKRSSTWKKAVRAKIAKRSGQKCHYCRRPFAMDDLTIDHRIPISCGGTNVKGNLVLACEPCNKEKGAKLPWEMK